MNKATNLSKASWVANGKRAMFASQQAYGVVNDKGQALSSDGISPSTWDTLKTTKEIALHCDGFAGYSWIDLL